MPITALMNRIGDARSLAQIVVETVREPLLVLDNKLKILVASNSFHKSFQIRPEDTPNHIAVRAGRRRLGHSGAAHLLERSLVDQTVVEGFLVEQEFPRIGARDLPAACPQGAGHR